MARIGMDVDVVTQHGGILKTVGDSDIPTLISRIDNLISEIQGSWWGPDAQHFHNSWTATDRPALTTIGHAITQFGQQAVVNAQIQASTSTATST
jgi:uncharacterized protein YukE